MKNTREAEERRESPRMRGREPRDLPSGLRRTLGSSTPFDTLDKRRTVMVAEGDGTDVHPWLKKLSPKTKGIPMKTPRTPWEGKGET